MIHGTMSLKYTVSIHANKTPTSHGTNTVDPLRKPGLVPSSGKGKRLIW